MGYVYDDSFLKTFLPDFKTDSIIRNVVTSTYFSFTSLSTVGFGDLHPRNEHERLIAAFILLFGVAIFSYVMGVFIEILDEFKKFNQDSEDIEGDDLARFIQCLVKMNGKSPLNYEFQQKIETYFEYRWKFDKNQAIDDEKDVALLTQLPME